MDKYPKRLIEVDLPIKRISAHSRREKSIRHGHISTLHIWWARRPLAACRAVICASLWPDPADDLCPEMFRNVARAQMTKWAKNHLDLLSEESWARFVAISKHERKLDDLVELRAALLDFIADFSNWDNSTVTEYLETSRLLTQTAHESLGGEPGSRPLVVDPFAGGGAIPLEALRVGADAFASDLNPVAVLLNKIVLEYIPKYGQKLADEVRKWGEWIKEQAEKELVEFYPKDEDGATPIAYLWARTILSEAPGQGDIPVEVPLMRSMWIAKKKGRKYALRWVRRSDGHVCVETTEIEYADGDRLTILRPLMEIFQPQKDSEVEGGTIARGSATCPVTGYTTPVARIREQIKVRHGGANDARLIAVVVSRLNTKARTYRLPMYQDVEVFLNARKALEKLKAFSSNLAPIPNESLPPQGTLGFRVQPYGMTQWSDLYSDRQALALATICRLIHNTKDTSCPEEVTDLLALALGRLQDLNSSLSTWANTIEAICGANRAQNRLSMVWDYVEAVPIAGAGGDWLGQIDWLARVCNHVSASNISEGNVHQAAAQEPILPNDVANILFTDPPYYDAFAYADLADIFLAWVKRAVRNPQSSLGLKDAASMSPKHFEIVVNPAASKDGRGNKDRSWFETQMKRAFKKYRGIVKPNGIGVVVFAHKGTESWEALISGIIESGWQVTASWPIDTERPNRQRAQSSAALGSSIHLVCRPRENPDGSLRTDDVGDWRDVLAELPKRIHEWMPRLAEEGVVGADAIFACLGPALEIYSRYSSVEKASGEKVELKEYLEEVWAAVSREALNMIFEGADASGFEEDARLTAMWLWTLRTAADGEVVTDDDSEKKKSLPGFSLEYDAARKIAQGLGAHLENLSHLVEIKGNTAMLLSAAARTNYLFGKDPAEAPKGERKKKIVQQTVFNFEEDIKQIEQESGDWAGELSGKAGSTVLDQLHQSMILFAAGRGEAVKRFLVEEGVGRNPLFWRLAQALSALYPTSTDEKRWVDGVLARKKALGF